MSVLTLSKRKYFELEVKMEFMNYTGGGPTLARFKGT